MSAGLYQEEEFGMGKGSKSAEYIQDSGNSSDENKGGNENGPGSGSGGGKGGPPS